MKIINRLNRLEKQTQSEEEGPGRVAMKFNGGQITWNNKIFHDDESFRADVEEFFKNVPPPPQGPRLIMIRFWRDINDINLIKSGKQAFS